jgi:carbon monoxide dehydrogenase subunit G
VAARNGVFEVHGEFTAHAPVATVWEVLTDYEHIASFVSSIKSSAVVRQGDDSLRVHQVATVVVFPFHFTAHVTLVVREHAPRRIDFVDVLGKDFRRYAGSWSLREEAGSTVVEYVLEATPRSGAPGWIGRSMLSHGANDLLLEVREEVERRARGAAVGGR